MKLVNSSLDYLYFFLSSSLKSLLYSYCINVYGDFVIYIKHNDIFLYLTNFIRKNTLLRFSQFIDICVIDYPSIKKRFVFVYNFMSLQFNKRILCKLFLDNGDFISSIDSIFYGANWSEREVWDMFGIIFTGSYDLRRILTDYGFEGYPLKKDFPLTGYLELYYDEEFLSLKYVPVELSQDFRVFSFLSPWEVII